MGYTSLTPAEIPIKVCEAAKKAFRQNGIVGTQMKELAKATGIGRATLYRYFPSIEPIAFTVAASYMKDIYEAEKAFVKEHEDSFEDGFTLLCEAKKHYAKFWIENVDREKFFAQFDSIYPPPYPDKPEAEAYQREIAKQQALDSSLLRKGIEDGSIRTDINPYESFRILNEALIGYIQRGSRLNYSQSQLDSSSFLIDLFMESMKAKK